jgi:drug/metabolite transporter (DMT)-like permease
MTALLSRIVFNERFDRVKIISIGLSFAGTILVSGAHDPAMWMLNPAGIIFGLLTGLFFAIYNLAGKAASDRHIDSWTALLYSFSAATVFLFLFNLGFNTFNQEQPFANLLWLGKSAAGWGILFFLGVAPTLGGFGLYTLSMRYLSPTVSNLIATLEPAFTAAWAYLFLQEVLAGAQITGSIILFAGVLLLRVGRSENKK